jgi:hypothetical protein
MKWFRDKYNTNWDSLLPNDEPCTEQEAKYREQLYSMEAELAVFSNVPRSVISIGFNDLPFMPSLFGGN